MVGAVGIELKARLKARKLLILLNAKNTKKSDAAEVRYTAGTWERIRIDPMEGCLIHLPAHGKCKQLTAAGYRAHSVRQMLKRRLEDAGLPHIFSPAVDSEIR
jgi:hypothetical protein